MNTHLRSNNISLLFANDIFGYNTVNELWETFRRTAVEPGQSSSPDFASFADDCLLCTQIVKNDPTTAQDENNRSLWGPGGTQGPPYSTYSADITPPPSPNRTVGLVYLYAGPANLPGGEASIGVITKPDMQRRGYAREAVQLVLRWAFEELKFHRVQAAVLDTPSKDRALRLFIGSGFAHEGTKRRAVYQPEGEGMAGVWRDVTYLAMLDTEWVLKSTWMRDNRVPRPPIPSVWDEMFARHTREREELLQWEERHGRVRRTSSTETLREYARNAAQNMAYLTDDTSSSFSGSSPPSPRSNIIVSWEDDMDMVDDLDHDELHHDWEEIETSPSASRHRPWTGSSALDAPLQGHMHTLLPSIPSTTGLSEENSQSPLTIPSRSTPRSTPPSSPSPSPEPSSVHSSRIDTEDEDEDNWLPREDLASIHVPIPFTMPRDPRTSPAGSRSRSSSVSSSSTNTWSDAQSSVGASSGSWDVLSNTSDHSHGRV